MILDPSELARAVADATSPNVTTGLDFLVARAIESKDPAKAYDIALIRAAAVAKGSEVLAASDRLKIFFGKDFAARRFTTSVRETKAELEQQAKASQNGQGWVESASGEKKPVLANAITQLSTVLDLAFDSFSSVVTIKDRSPWGTSGRWLDIDSISAANYLQHSSVTVSSAVAQEAAIYLAFQKPFHPVRDWLTALKWDGTPRLEILFPHYFGTRDDAYHRKVSILWPMSAVARIMRSGCIVKYMPVLEGPQDEGKSKGLRLLINGHIHGDTGVQWFRDNMPPLDHKDIGQYMQGVWVIEAAELAAISGRKDWEATKAFISSPRDVFRAPYGRNMQEYPRQCVFAGTTNDSQWGGDRTGLTRFWPMKAGAIHFDQIARDREQIWAEARTLFDEDRPWWGDQQFSALARAEQEERAPDDTLAAEVLAACTRLTGMSIDDVSVPEILKELNITDDRQKTNRAPMIGRILSSAGWEQFRVQSGDRQRRYRKPE